MGTENRISNAAEKASGKVKEGLGHATGNEKMETEGRIDQTKADVKNVGEDVKDHLHKDHHHHDDRGDDDYNDDRDVRV